MFNIIDNRYIAELSYNNSSFFFHSPFYPFKKIGRVNNPLIMVAVKFVMKGVRWKFKNWRPIGIINDNLATRVANDTMTDLQHYANTKLADWSKTKLWSPSSNPLLNYITLILLDHGKKTKKRVSLYFHNSF